MMRNYLFRYFMVLYIIVIFILSLYASLYVKSQTWGFREVYESKDCTGKCTKILLVAYPQIKVENSSYWWNRWLSDKYIEVTYKVAYKFVQPDLVIIIGDLVNKGYTPTDEQFARDKSRLDIIFPIMGNETRMFIPGDNDMSFYSKKIRTRVRESPDGGFEIEPYETNRFQEAFGYNEFISVNGYNFIHADYEYSQMIKNISKGINILVMIQPPRICEVCRMLDAQLVFTGNLASRYQAYIDQKLNLRAKYYKYQEIGTYKLNRKLTRVIGVPTCSYHFGKFSQGFGYGVLHHEVNVMFYTILWSPPWLTMFYAYLGLLIVGISVCSCKYVKRKRLLKSCRRYKSFRT